MFGYFHANRGLSIISASNGARREFCRAYDSRPAPAGFIISRQAYFYLGAKNGSLAQCILLSRLIQECSDETGSLEGASFYFGIA